MAYTVHVLLLFNEFTIYEHIVVEILGKLQRQIEILEEGIKMDLKGVEFDLKCVKFDSQPDCCTVF